MKPNKPRTKWHPIDEAAAKALVQSTENPGVVFPVSTNALPAQIQKMKGLVSYFVSGYSTANPIGSSVTVGGEMAVVRTDSDLGKGYNYVFGTSNNGQVVFNGPYKNFPDHHFASSSPVPIERLFGHVSFTNKTKL